MNYDEDLLQMENETEAYSLEDEDDDETLHYGFIPNKLFVQLTDCTNWRIRRDAVENLEKHVVKTSIRVMRPYLKSVIKMFLNLIEDTNFNITMMSFKIFDQLLGKIGVEMLPHHQIIVDKLIQKLGDSKQSIRNASSLLLTQLVKFCSAKKILTQIVAALPTQNFHAKEEIINFIIYCLLMNPDEAYDYERLIAELKETMNDARLRIKFVSVEAIAVIHANLGSEVFIHLDTMKRAHSENYQLLIERFEQNTLPTIECDNPEQGLICHKLLAKNRGSRSESLSASVEDSKRSSTNQPNVNRIPWDLPRSARIKSAPMKKTIDLRLHDDSDNSDSDAETSSSISHNGRHIGFVDFKHKRSLFPKLTPRSPSSPPTSNFSPLPSPTRSPCFSPSFSPSFSPTVSPSSEGLRNWNFERSRKRLKDLDSASPNSNRDSGEEVVSKKVGLWLSEKGLSDSASSASSCDSDMKSTELPAIRIEKANRAPIFHKANPRFALAIETAAHDLSEIESGGKSAKREVFISAQKTLQFTVTSSTDSSDESPNSDEEQPPQHQRQHTHSNQKSRKQPMPLQIKPMDDISTDDLIPSSNPLKEVNQAIDQLSSDNWELQLNGILSVRRLALYHRQMLPPKIHQIAILLTGFVNNLRSSLSKNAIICCGELFQNLGKEMEGELEFIVPSLMKKTAEANRFITSEAEKALMSIVRNIASDKALGCILQFSDQKSALIRAQAAMLLHEVVLQAQTKIFKYKDIGRLLHSISKFLNDGSFESRKWGRTLALKLNELSTLDLDLALRKHLSEARYKEFKEAIKKGIPPSTTERKNRFSAGKR